MSRVTGTEVQGHSDPPQLASLWSVTQVDGTNIKLSGGNDRNRSTTLHLGSTMYFGTAVHKSQSHGNRASGEVRRAANEGGAPSVVFTYALTTDAETQP
eukprot:192878-Prymnesium_polylepis.1